MTSAAALSPRNITFCGTEISTATVLVTQFSPKHHVPHETIHLKSFVTVTCEASSPVVLAREPAFIVARALVQLPSPSEAPPLLKSGL